MYKLANETRNMKKEFSEILMNIELFEFEDRKHIQRIIGDLDL